MELTGAGTAPALPSPAGHVEGPRSEQPPQATVLPTGPAAVRTRLKWYTISTRVEGAARGVAKVIHPFLVNHSTNWMDIMLVQHLLVEEPFSASFGKSGSAWKDFVTALSGAEDPDGNLVYGIIGIRDKAAKKRFEDLMEYVKKAQDNVPFQSGCDDQAPSTELEAGLDNLYELYCEKKCDAKVSSNSTAAQKAEDNARVETLRNVSLGMLTPQEKIRLKERRCGTPGINSTGPASTSAAGGSSKKRHLNVVIDLMESTSERYSKRQESRVAREARKQEKHNIKQAHQELEFNLKKDEAARAEREFQFKKDEAERAYELQKLQLELNRERLLVNRETLPFLREKSLPPHTQEEGKEEQQEE